MREAVDVYARFDELGVAEQVALESVADRVRDGSILDIGVGGGRTVAALLELSTDYLGIDYVEEMVTACQARFPGVRFEHADARAMPQYADASFDLIVFAWAGICMVNHAGRLAILSEIRRLLKPGGAFVFSSYNQNGSDYTRLFEFPKFNWTTAPIQIVKEFAAFIRSFSIRVFNRIRYLPKEIRTSEFGIINDISHDYSTMLYYITLSNQIQQLRDAGFMDAINAYDATGNPVINDTADNSITYVAFA